MDELSAGLRARMALDRFGFKTAHALGQNFILDDEVIDRLLDDAEIAPDDDVLEIGPGAGVMSAHLAARCRSLIAVELDEKLRPVLEEVLSGRENVRLVFGDALKQDLSAITGDDFPGEFRVVANLPYYITSDAIEKLLRSGCPITSLTLMVQKEAADRLLSSPGEKSWCALAALVRYYAEAEVLAEVPPEVFQPAPHVMSALIRLNLHAEKPVQPKNEALFLELITSAFAMRRKTLANNLKASFCITQQDAIGILRGCGLSDTVRGEALQLDQLKDVADALDILLASKVK